MNLIDQLFQKLRSEKKRAFMPFIPAGDPNLAVTAELLEKLPEAGADLIELGFPFSDPIADGPVIAASYTRALDQGLKLDEIFTMLANRANQQTPIVAMVSYSLIHRYSPQKFIAAAVQSRISGVILPDLPGDEPEEFVALANEAYIKTIFLVTPTTTLERAKKILSRTTGFVYCVSVVGITGERDRLPEALTGQLQQLRQITSLPLCVGFGVSKPSHVDQLKSEADGIIVGSALVKYLEKMPQQSDQAMQGILELSAQLAAAAHTVS